MPRVSASSRCAETCDVKRPRLRPEHRPQRAVAQDPELGGGAPPQPRERLQQVCKPLLLDEAPAGHYDGALAQPRRRIGGLCSLGEDAGVEAGVVDHADAPREVRKPARHVVADPFRQGDDGARPWIEPRQRQSKHALAPGDLPAEFDGYGDLDADNHRWSVGDERGRGQRCDVGGVHDREDQVRPEPPDQAGERRNRPAHSGPKDMQVDIARELGLIRAVRPHQRHREAKGSPIEVIGHSD